MPRESLIAGSHRDSGQVEKFDQLKLDKDDVGRLWLPGERLDGRHEDFAWVEWTHTIRGPIFEEDGRPIMTTKESKGGFREVFKTDFIGRRICLGVPSVLEAKEIDPDQCPACAAVERWAELGIPEVRDMRPQRRFAIPVIKYATQNRRDADKLQNPPGGQVLVWALSQWTYNKVDDIRGQIGELLDKAKEDVRFHMVDIAVHCDSGTWQTLDRVWPLRPAWRHERVRDLVRELWGDPANRPTDAQLRAACGREPDRTWMMTDVEEATERWLRAVNFGKGGVADPASGGAMSGGELSQDDLDGLLGDAPSGNGEHPGGLAEFAPSSAADDDLFGGGAPAPAAAAPAPEANTDDDLFGAGARQAPAAASPAPQASTDGDLFGDTAPAAAAAEAPAAAGKPGTVASFDDIFESAS